MAAVAFERKPPSSQPAEEQRPPGRAHNTWNTPERIAAHRAMSHEQRLALTIEASRAALRFAHGARDSADR